MTLPTERTQAVLNTEKRIQNLREYVSAPGVEYGSIIMVRASDIIELIRGLKHYPTGYDLEISHEKCPEIWGKKP